MSLDKINSKIKAIYSKLNSPKYITHNWIIVADKMYEKYKNKLTITNINNIQSELITNSIVINIMCESKNKYYYIKYSPQFIGIVESDTEYGLVLDSYDIFAVNTEVLDSPPPFNRNLLNIKGIFNVLGWKLSKKAKEYIENI